MVTVGAIGGHVRVDADDGKPDAEPDSTEPDAAGACGEIKILVGDDIEAAGIDHRAGHDPGGGAAGDARGGPGRRRGAAGRRLARDRAAGEVGDLRIAGRQLMLRARGAAGADVDGAAGLGILIAGGELHDGRVRTVDDDEIALSAGQPLDRRRRRWSRGPCGLEAAIGPRLTVSLASLTCAGPKAEGDGSLVDMLGERSGRVLGKTQYGGIVRSAPTSCCRRGVAVGELP